MKKLRYHHRVEAEIEVSRAELAALVRLAKRHYDGTCRGLAEVGGFLYGWERKSGVYRDEETIEVCVDWQQLDILCKVTESDPGAVDGLRRIFLELREETARLNPRAS